MEALLVNCVSRSLNQFMFSNAIFLCERLCAEFPSEVNLQLLARCYLSNNQPYCAYHILKGSQMAQSRYLFALSCFKMDLLSEAETALLSTKEPIGEVPNSAAGHYLLGLIYRYTDRRKNSVEHFRDALSIDPLFWAAYEELCILGAAEEAAAVFGEDAVLCIQELYLDHRSSYLQTASDDQLLGSCRTCGLEYVNTRSLKHLQGNDLRDTYVNHHGAATLAGSVLQSTNGCPPNSAVCSIPFPVVTQMSDIAPAPLCKNVQLKPRALGGEGLSKCVTGAPRRKNVGDSKSVKVSGRLFSGSGLRRSCRLAAKRNTTASLSSGNGSSYLPASLSKSNPTIIHSAIADKSQSENTEEGKGLETTDRVTSDYTASSCALSFAEGRSFQHETSTKLSGFVMNVSTLISGITDMLNLLKNIGEGYRLLCLYRCQDALDVYQKLPQKQYYTGWVLSQVGKAYFELVDYSNADYAFSLAHQVSPYTLEGMDIYSTVLYHLKEEMKLSYLAQELLSIDRLAPETWCAIGNCYSLQKDPETALKYFLRAVQLNSRFAYAHTLCGHEYTALEDYENGVRCYQSALHLNARHYNAWYGLGMIYLRQERFEFAKHHFGQALQINPQSSVIMCYIGTTLHALKRTDEALEMLENAISADVKNPLPRYYKATILVSLGIFDKALEVLEELKEEAPHECSIHALLGKLYKQCKLFDKAMLHFGIALDSKPDVQDAAKIKASMEALLVQDEVVANW